MRLAIVLGFAAVAAGAFLTWSDNTPFSQSGVERTAGLFAIVAALGAGIIALVDRRPRGAIIAVSAGSLVVIATLVELIDLASGPGSPGTGLYVSLAGALLATAAAGWLAFSLFRKPDAAA